MTDIGWLNSATERPNIEVMEALCRSLGHKPICSGGWTDNQVACDVCGYVYHYDSSD
jgi:hypothetical protein